MRVGPSPVKLPTLPEVEREFTRDEYRVAVYWPNEGYGGCTTHKTLAEAKAQVEKDKVLGYGKPGGRNQIHVWRVRHDIIEVEGASHSPPAPEHPTSPERTCAGRSGSAATVQKEPPGSPKEWGTV